MSMKPQLSVFLTTLTLVAVSAFPAQSGEPSADQLLRQMSAKLASAKSFTYSARREMDPILAAENNLPQSARINVSVMRPDKLAAVSESKEGTRRFVANGKTLSVAMERDGIYAAVPMRTSIDGLVIELEKKFGFTPPLAEFALSDLYQNFRRHARKASYMGREKVHSGFLGLETAECDRLLLSGPEADAELWIATSDQLPRKLVVTFRNHAKKPKFSVAFANWNLAAPLSASDFAFTPAKGAAKVDMWTTAQMKARFTESKN